MNHKEILNSILYSKPPTIPTQEINIILSNKEDFHETLYLEMKYCVENKEIFENDDYLSFILFFLIGETQCKYNNMFDLFLELLKCYKDNDKDNGDFFGDIIIEYLPTIMANIYDEKNYDDICNFIKNSEYNEFARWSMMSCL